MDFLAGQTLLIDKPKEWSSFDVIRKIRYTIRIKKVGHAGTLDPLATGLLIVCTGKHTKQINDIQDQEKEYEVAFKIGFTTASYDMEHPEINPVDAQHITQEQIKDAMTTFLGEIEQTPPIYSAVKVDGKRAYKAARKGQDVKLKSRRIHIYAFEYLKQDTEDPMIHHARIRCSKGTYIRTLVHDLGQLLGVGAYIRELRRTRIGTYRIEDAWQIDDFAAKYQVPREPKSLPENKPTKG
ncbi:MAG: tRNA pseudouridine(55) synthase TruB [Bacteroidota bacterium]